MKKFRVEKRSATQSQDRIKEYIEPVSDSSSVDQPVFFIFPNRRDVVVGESLITTGSHSTSNAIVADNDLGNEGFVNMIVASQTGLEKFQETRVLSSKEIRRLTIEAFKKAEERRKQRLSLEEIEIDL